MKMQAATILGFNGWLESECPKFQQCYKGVRTANARTRALNQVSQGAGKLIAIMSP